MASRRRFSRWASRFPRCDEFVPGDRSEPTPARNLGQYPGNGCPTRVHMSPTIDLSGYSGKHILPDGTHISIRPIGPDDAALERDFVNKLSERSRYLRFMNAIKAITPQMVSRFTHLDYHREMALIALIDGDSGPEQVAVARFASYPDGRGCEFAIVVADRFQGKGIATELLRRLIAIARERQFQYMDGLVLRENTNMIRLAKELGFEQRPDPDDPKVFIMKLSL